MNKNLILLQINTVVNSGFTGRIAEEIGSLAIIHNGWKSYIAYGRGNRASSSQLFRIGSDFNMYSNALPARIFDSDGFDAKKTTLDLIQYIEKIKPSIIQLHNLHDYYLNVEILFAKSYGLPLVSFNCEYGCSEIIVDKICLSIKNESLR